MRQRGFTLTELLIVVAILGITASLAIPKLLPNTEKARVSEAAAVLTAIRQGETDYRMEHPTYLAVPAGSALDVWQRIGFDANPHTGRNYFNYTVRLTAGGFVAQATRNGTENAGATAGALANSTVCLNQDGQWGGTNIFSPRTVATDANCGSVA